MLVRAEREAGATFALADTGFLDFECRCPLPITVGTRRYAASAAAVILSYAIGAGPVQAVAVGDFSEPLGLSDMPEDFIAHMARVAAGRGIWAAWNAGFDRAIWNLATRGFPLLPPCHIIDVMAQATASGLPPDLKGAAEASGSEHKAADGKDLIKLFCGPEAGATPKTRPFQWDWFIEYARQDVTALRSVFLGTRQLPLAEWEEYWTMEAVNERGLAIDLELVAHAANLAVVDRTRSVQELAELTAGAVKSVDQVARMTAWLLARLPRDGRDILLKVAEEKDADGVLVRPAKHALTRSRVQRLIAYCREQTGFDAVLRVLQIRLYGGSKTPAKFAKMLQQHVDGVLYGQYVFNGASQTGRASSKGVQIHNLARDTLAREHDTIEAILAGCSYDALAALNPDPVARQLSLLIRPAFVPSGDNLFVWSDWSQIEARILPWLTVSSGGDLRLDVFRAVDRDPSVPDLYTRTAAVLSRLPIERVTKPIRQRGKVAELALGFGGGVGALQALAAGYGMHIDDESARETVERWRSANSWCVEFWRDLVDAAMLALRLPGAPQQVGRLVYVYLHGYLGGSLLCRLPSGRCLTYRNIRWDLIDDLDDNGEVIGKSKHLRFSRGHGRVELWHGMLCENVVQAAAADILRGTLRRLVDAGFDVRAHTHDEVLLETSSAAAKGTAAALREVMREGFDWSDGLPLMSEETISPYYTKSTP